MAINIEPALSPHLVVDDAAAAIDFYVKAFGAEELGRVPGPDGRLVHAALRINGFTVMLNDDFPEMCGGKSMTPKSLGGTPVTIHQTVTDVDAKFQRALDAGATVVAPLSDQFWGDRYGVVADPVRHKAVEPRLELPDRVSREIEPEGLPLTLQANGLTPVGQLRRPQGNYNLRAIIRRQAEHVVLPRLVSL